MVEGDNPEMDEENRVDSEFKNKKIYSEIEKQIRLERKQVGSKESKYKLEDYDFPELVGDLTNSVTDQLYREFFPPAKAIYHEEIKEGKDKNYKNDLDVSDIVTDLKEELVEHVRHRVTKSLSARMRVELEEQYHPTVGSKEQKVDDTLKNMRNIAIYGYYFIGLILVTLVVLVGIETLAIGLKTGWLFKDFALSVMDGNFVSSVDRSLLNKIIFSILSVLDLLLLASLVVMVLIGGYENTVSRIGGSHDVPTWFGSLGITDLKIKVAASIVIISSIHLLTQFMLIEPTMPDALTPDFKKLVACNSEKRELAALYKKDGGYSDVSSPMILSIEGAHKTCLSANSEKEKIELLQSANIDNADDYFARIYSKSALMWTSIVHGVFVLAALALAFMGTLSKDSKRLADQRASDAVDEIRRDKMEAEAVAETKAKGMTKDNEKIR